MIGHTPVSGVVVEQAGNLVLVDTSDHGLLLRSLHYDVVRPSTKWQGRDWNPCGQQDSREC